MRKDYTKNVERVVIKEKARLVEEIKKDMKNYPTIAIVDLRMLPDALLQSSKKSLREKDGTKIKVAKLAVIKRALETNEKLAKYAAELNSPVALVFTRQSPYQLAKFFRENKKKRAAKIGELSPFDIIIPAGDTDIPPGPALTELKSAGLNVQIKGGKIAISKESVLAKEGERLTEMKVKALQKLAILPFDVGVKLIGAYDGEYIYPFSMLEIDEVIIGAEIRAAASDAFNLSVNGNYPTEENITLLLKNAVGQAFNFCVNGNVYSSMGLEQLLSSAYRQGMALSSVEKK